MKTIVTVAASTPDLPRKSEGDIIELRDIIEKIDRPFFEDILAMPGGFDAAIHGIMEIRGLVQRWRRPPFTSLDDEATERLGGLLDRLQSTMGDIRDATD